MHELKVYITQRGSGHTGGMRLRCMQISYNHSIAAWKECSTRNPSALPELIIHTLHLHIQIT